MARSQRKSIPPVAKIRQRDEGKNRQKGGCPLSCFSCNNRYTLVTHRRCRCCFLKSLDLLPAAHIKARRLIVLGILII